MIQNEPAVRSGTAAEWADTNPADGAAAPVLGTGEVGVNVDNGQLAVGDGASAYTALLKHRPAKITAVTLVSGTKVTADTTITATTLIIPVLRALGTVTAAKLITVTRSAGVSFTLTSSDNTDTSIFDVLIIQP